MAVKTPEQVKQEFLDNGVAISTWAEEHGLSVAVVYAALTGRRKGMRGQTHRAMVLLGLKPSAAGHVGATEVAK